MKRNNENENWSMWNTVYHACTQSRCIPVARCSIKIIAFAWYFSILIRLCSILNEKSAIV